MRSKARRRLTWEILEARFVLNADVVAPASIDAPGLAAEVSARVSLASVTPTLRLDEGAVQRHADNLALVNAGGASNIVFFGDSITQRWGLGDGPGVPVWNQSIAPLGAANFGIDGDRTQNLLMRMRDGELNGLPKLAVVMIGTNNLRFFNDNGSADETVAGISAVIATIRSLSPETKVLLLGLLPRGGPNDPVRGEIQQVNSKIAGFQDGTTLVYRDLSSLFLRPDGTIPAALMPDGLHPSEAGYWLMTDALQAPLHALLGLPTPDPTSYGGPILVDTPSDQVIEALDERGALIAFVPPLAFDALDPHPVIASDPPRGNVLPIGTTVVTWTATDRFGHSASTSFTVEVRPGVAPVLHDVPANAVVEATSPLGAVVHFALPTATDDTDPDVRVISVPPSGSTFPIGTTVVACTATDGVGHVTTATFLMIVRDSNAPAIVSVPDLVVEATGASGAAVNFTQVAAADLIDPDPIIRYSPPSGTTFPLGTTFVTCTVMDRSGNVSTTSFQVTVHDTPVLHNVPSTLVVEATSAHGAVVVYTSPTATDAANPSIRVTNSKPSGSTFPIGATIVTSFARGVTGVTTSATFTVTVVPRATVAPVSTLARNAMAQAAAAIGSSPPPRRRRLGTLDFGHVTPGQANADTVTILTRMDANRNLQVTQKEMTAFISAILDRNRDGKVSLYEQTLAQQTDPQGSRFLFPGS